MPERRKGRRRVGLIVNPLAGIGGRVGLKGSDGTAIVERALALGAVPAAGARAAETLSHLRDLADVLDLGTYRPRWVPGPPAKPGSSRP